VGCTAWLIDDCAHCFLTAGHCGTSSGSIGVCEFNVPFSNPNGSLVHPGPEDQYVSDPASIQSNGGQGTGNDWAYFGTFPNTQTGLTAGEAQGAWFTLAPPPPVAGSTIRITGHGTDSSPNSTYNQIQQTHNGPFWLHSGTLLQYQVDTTGGNSGSPVIWDDADVAIGIHTHAGCSATSGNQGTSSQHPGLQAALAAPQGVCGFACFWSDLGNGLAGALGVPALTPYGLAVAGQPMRLAASQLPPGSTSNLVAGFSTLYANFKGGVLVPSPDVVVPGLPAPNGTAVFGFTFPAAIPSGSQIVFQFWTADVQAAQGFSATNAQQLNVP
jgi:V8-like Glu-specific endopeptidase